MFTCEDPDVYVRGSFYLHQHISQRAVRTSLEMLLDATAPRGVSVPELLRKPIATCDLPSVSRHPGLPHMGQNQLLSVLAARLSPLNIDHSRNLPVEICGINYTGKYTSL